MRRSYPGNIILTLAGFILHLLSCSPGACFDETESRIKATFYSMETGKPLAPDSLTLFGIGMDTSRIYDRVLNLKSAEFPLYAEESSCKFIIRINGINDTLEFSYDSNPHLLSKECGYAFFFTLDTAFYSLNSIDSLSINKNTITTFNEENLRIYY